MLTARTSHSVFLALICDYADIYSSPCVKTHASIQMHRDLFKSCVYSVAAQTMLQLVQKVFGKYSNRMHIQCMEDAELLLNFTSCDMKCIYQFECCLCDTDTHTNTLRFVRSLSMQPVGGTLKALH